ncbi:Uncharacterized protein TPAR_04024 [Tolypocladium paradoxum]|uniref:Uncharacterized protein n=1 Tax=Tolypocladium paradoxum TaxID=94208 RepID=A0A2S4L027_9HYPO|nr:Uncharacterized protein TPAR_04024 [Tolypocladium paradoxum]
MHLRARTAPVAGGAGHDWRHPAILLRRRLDDRNLAFVIIIAVLVVLSITVFVLVAFAKRRRRQRRGQKSEDQAHGVFDNVLSFWQPNASRYEQASGDDVVDGQRQSVRLDQTPSRESRDAERRRISLVNNTSSNSGAAVATAGAAVDRNTSVRSIMTLPAYRQTAATNEQVLGREGERGGVDVIIDYPTAEDDEALREEEMDTLYQIRVERRRQIEEREELRRQRDAARRRNDGGALADIRARARAASNNSQLDGLRREVGRIQENRQRSVSSVSYADLGVARHDGTRIRANSNESERVGLLSDAASIAVSNRSGAPSPALHRREPSASSLVSVDSDFLPPTLARPRRASQPNSSRLSSGGEGAGSSPELVEADLGEETMPPPEYEDVSLDSDELMRSTTPLHDPPPDYPGPYRSASQRSERRPLAASAADPEPEQDASRTPRTTRGVGGVPQLPSLRISRLPAIVIEPSNEDPRSSR